MIIKKFIRSFALFAAILSVAATTVACSETSDTTSTTTTTSSSSDSEADEDAEDADEDDAVSSVSTTVASEVTVELTSFDTRTTYDDATEINLDECSGKVEITTGGTYVLTGTLSDGYIYIDVTDTEKVQLVLNGATITNSDGAAIYIENADKTSITLADGTTNTLTDGGDGTNATSVIVSKDDLTINGDGTLVINSTVKTGIKCNNDLKIVSGTITIDGAYTGIKAKDSLAIFGGTITINADNDAIKCTDKSDYSDGYFYMEDGTLNITAGDDGIVATITVTITGGTINMSVAGNQINCDGDEYIVDGVIA